VLERVVVESHASSRVRQNVTMFRKQFRTLARPAALATAGVIVANYQRSAECLKRGTPPPVHDELQKLRLGEAAMRERWEADEAGWHKLPPRAWPPYQPKLEEIQSCTSAHVASCQASGQASGAASASALPECVQATFDLATCLIFNGIDVVTGLREYRALAEAGHYDSMVGIGIVLVEGISDTKEDPATGLHWLGRAAAGNSAQAQYELGVLHYMGIDEHLAMDESAAFEWFSKAAQQGHTSALFMLADCLLDGCGCERDAPRAVPLLHAAAERGHRFARQYVLEWLDEDAAAARG